MSVYYYKSSEKKMAIRATLQTKLACGALTIIITNVCFLIAIIAFISHEEMCKLTKQDIDKNKSFTPFHLTTMNVRTSINEYPWMIAFMILPDEIFIGTAAIITNKWAITTAYCINKVDKVPMSKKGFRGGSTFWNKRGFYHYAANIVSHKQFNNSTLDYNVALIKVIHPFKYEYEIPIKIAKLRFRAAGFTEVIGWATREKPKIIIDDLLRIHVELLSEKLCEKTLERFKNDTSIFRSLCTYKKADKYRTECDFSSGSALVVNRKLVGLTTSGVMCSESHLPGIYINLATVTDWIENILPPNTPFGV